MKKIPKIKLQLTNNNVFDSSKLKNKTVLNLIDCGGKYLILFKKLLTFDELSEIYSFNGFLTIRKNII